MSTALLVLALVVQVLLVPVVGLGAVGASEHANAYGPKVLGPLAGLLGWSGVLVVVALVRSLTGVGDGMLVVAWATPVLALLVLVVGGDGLHGSGPTSALRRALETTAAVAVTALPAVLVEAAYRAA